MINCGVLCQSGFSVDLYLQFVFLYRVFEKCHKLLNPVISYKACVYDVCHMQNATGCSSLENYAHMCADESICVDWRGLTNGMCGKE